MKDAVRKSEEDGSGELLLMCLSMETWAGKAISGGNASIRIIVTFFGCFIRRDMPGAGFMDDGPIG